MMRWIAPRWRKVLRDLWNNRSRSILIILCIAVGVFAIGTILATTIILNRDIPERFREIKPAHITFRTSLINDDTVATVARMPMVEAAEGRNELEVRIETPNSPGTWRSLLLYTLADYSHMEIYKIWHLSGNWPPGRREMLLDRGSMTYLNLKEGQVVTLKNGDNRLHKFTISGVAHDLYHMPAFMEGTVYGFIHEDTLKLLGEPSGYNELHLRLRGDPNTLGAIQTLKKKVTDKLEDAGHVVYYANMPRPDVYPMAYITDTVSLLLMLVGVLILLLGAFLIINTISALIAQQVRQIGVIKAVGGSTAQVAGIYLVMVLILGLIASLIGFFPSIYAARALASFIADMLNYIVNLENFPYEVILVQLAVGMALPVGVALIPVLSGAQTPPAQALSEYGRSQVWTGLGWVDKILGKLSLVASRLTLFSIRNPFRRKARLVFSLISLTLAGGTFIGVLSLHTSLTKNVDGMIAFWQYDVWATLNRPMMEKRLIYEGSLVPGVVKVEGWTFQMTRRVRPDASESNPIYLFGVPPDSTMVKPLILEGRWLETTDTNAVVVCAGLLTVEPDLKVGQEVIFKVDGDEKRFKVVGTLHTLGNETVGYVAYAPDTTLSRMSKQANRSTMAMVKITPTEVEEKRLVAAAVEDHFNDAGIGVQSVILTDDERIEINSAFSIVIVLLMIMVFMLALVGGLGLMGVMSLNVLDRTREIGVMRAFGASNIAVFKSVLIEGAVIGLMSWVTSLLLSIPLGWGFSYAIGVSFLSTPLFFYFSYEGALLWLALVCLISALSSMAPAWSAVNLTVREVLAYE